MLEKEALSQHLESLTKSLLPQENAVIPHDKSFIALGLDSLKIADLTSHINRSLNTDIGIEHIFEYCSLGELSEYLSQLEPTEIK